MGVSSQSGSPRSPLAGHVSSEETQFLLQRRWGAHSPPPHGFGGEALQGNSLLAGPRLVLNTHSQRLAAAGTARLPPSAPHPAPSRSTHPRAPGAGFGPSSGRTCRYPSVLSSPLPTPTRLPELSPRRSCILLLCVLKPENESTQRDCSVPACSAEAGNNEKSLRMIYETMHAHPQPHSGVGEALPSPSHLLAVQIRGMWNVHPLPGNLDPLLPTVGVTAVVQGVGRRGRLACLQLGRGPPCPGPLPPPETSLPHSPLPAQHTHAHAQGALSLRCDTGALGGSVH